MIKVECLTFLKDKMEALDPEKIELYKFLGFAQDDKMPVKRIMERVTKEIGKRLFHFIGLDQNLMRAINSRMISIAGYVMNYAT